MVSDDRSWGEVQARHMPSLTRVAAALEAGGFQVDLEGSAATRPDYRDIDLVLTPQTPHSAYAGALDDVVRTLSQLTDFQIISAQAEIEQSYAGRLVQARYQFSLGGANFDVSCDRRPPY